MDEVRGGSADKAFAHNADRDRSKVVHNGFARALRAAAPTRRLETHIHLAAKRVMAKLVVKRSMSVIRKALVLSAVALSIPLVAPAIAQRTSATTQSTMMPSASNWELGPFINGKNRTMGMPLHPTQLGNRWYFDFPNPDAMAGHVHYTTYPSGSLTGARRIVMRYRIDAARGTRFVPVEAPDAAATLSLYFQRSGIKWSGKGEHAYDRWWLSDATMKQIRAGEYEIVANLNDPNWISVWGQPAGAHPEQFQDALSNVSRIGFVMGYAGGRGHGVYATGPARFTMLDFRVE